MYFLVWLFFGIFSSLLASNKNRNVIGWFFIGFLFGPFGLLFAFFMKDGNEIENTSNIQFEKVNDVIMSNDTYYYQIKPKDGVLTEDEWHKVKKAIFKHLTGNYKIKQNDNDAVLIEVSKSSYIKMTKAKTPNEKGSIKLFFIVESIKCGALDFGNDIEVYQEKKEGSNEVIKDGQNLESTEKLIKLAELLEKGHITEEEFASQKAKILNN